jgi:hypothetical protein
MTKAQKIRNYIAANPDATGPEIVKTLKHVTPSQVYHLLQETRQSKGKPAPAPTPAPTSATIAEPAYTVAQISAARKALAAYDAAMTAAFGGDFDRAEALVNALR